MLGYHFFHFAKIYAAVGHNGCRARRRALRRLGQLPQGLRAASLVVVPMAVDQQTVMGTMASRLNELSYATTTAASRLVEPSYIMTTAASNRRGVRR
jgi:hypothetical protein